MWTSAVKIWGKDQFFVSHFDGFLKRLCAFGVKIKLSTWPNQTISHVWFVNIATLLFVFSLLSMLRKPSQLTIENKRTDGIKQDHGGGGAFHILLWIFIGKAHLFQDIMDKYGQGTGGQASHQHLLPLSLSYQLPLYHWLPLSRPISIMLSTKKRLLVYQQCKPTQCTINLTKEIIILNVGHCV